MRAMLPRPPTPLLAALLCLAAFAPITPAARGAAGSSPAGLEAAASVSGQDAAELTARILAFRDDADPALLVQLANLRSRAAAEGLAKVYDAMGSAYMRREVLRALALLEGVGEAEKLAFEHIANVATESSDQDLREASIGLLAGAGDLGKFYLQVIVESAAEDSVREHAMRRHAERAEATDDPWYRRIYDWGKGEGPAEPRGRRRRDAGDGEAQEQPAAHSLPSLRRLAFEAMAPRLSGQDLSDALQDRDPGVRILALGEQQRRDPKAAHRRARDIYTKVDGNVEERILAARIVFQEEGARVADSFIDMAQRFITPMRLRLELADLLAELDDDRVRSKLSRLVGRGKDYEQIFALRASRKVQEKGFEKRLLRGLGDRSLEVRIATAEALGRRGVPDAEVIEALEKLVERSRDEPVTVAALDALSALRPDDAAWRAKLVELAGSEEATVRNAALVHLGHSRDPAHLDLLAEALSNPLWSTRFAALRGLEALRAPEVVPLLIERMPDEQGRMLYELSEALFRLTAQPYRTAAPSWKAWWEREGASFRLPTESELEAALAAKEERRMRQRTAPSFFGIRIESHRVIFIIDVSGSMNETMRGMRTGRSGETRMDVAKRELQNAIGALDSRALFNIIAFSSGLDRWLDEGIASSVGKSRDEAKGWVDRLGAMGATNLYDAIEMAFADPEVDTIFILGDGEPNVGGQTDPHVIREHVARWNEHRGVVIHTVTIGLDLPVLEWLSVDSGGTDVRFY